MNRRDPAPGRSTNAPNVPRRACAQWIESGERDGYQAFCPNAAFFERVTAAAKR